MGHSRIPKQRLPAHLSHLSRGPEAGSSKPPSGRPRPEPAAEPGTAGAPDRLSELLPLVLRAMVAGGAARPAGQAPTVVGQADVLAALAPYHRPRSRFEGLMIRKLVGEGYLRPRGARDKHGFSPAYELTPRGERLLGGRRGG
ncbi:hypothetical protein [Deinococcus planocerae]|uniref:hypothetical protein n=1 Tax=Deinococcus planocerae TaxID=1737569 RepID=UPI000C7F359C|nr:hypothetical protein [Deinococcus planocerae]